MRTTPGGLTATLDSLAVFSDDIYGVDRSTGTAEITNRRVVRARPDLTPWLFTGPPGWNCSIGWRTSAGLGDDGDGLVTFSLAIDLRAVLAAHRTATSRGAMCPWCHAGMIRSIPT